MLRSVVFHVGHEGGSGEAGERAMAAAGIIIEGSGIQRQAGSARQAKASQGKVGG